MSDPLRFETARLILRPWDPAVDLEDAFRIYSDPEVLKYIGGEERRVKSLDQLRDRMGSIMKVGEDGLGRWAIEVKSDRRVQGTIILQHIQKGFGEAFEDVEIGWHLGREAWGKGYASEAAKTLLRHGFETLGLAEIVAVLAKENEASARVAQRIGLKRIGETDRYYDQLLEVYKLTQPEFRALQSAIS
ncbi:MAG: GNAT family N-acetyltransferase [Armatimonadetes bacterium]|nr:GNAT family N-acetyltransferase [Armatimonadota bacterium]